MVAKRILISFFLTCAIAFVVLISEGIKLGHSTEALEFFAAITLGVAFFALPIWLGQKYHFGVLKLLSLIFGIDIAVSFFAWVIRDNAQLVRLNFLFRYFLATIILSAIMLGFLKVIEFFIRLSLQGKNNNA